MVVGRFAGIDDGRMSYDTRDVLERYRRLAVVGLSPNPARPSYRAMVHMKAAGYDITPVNPRCEEVLGVPCVPSLAAAAELGPLEIVDIFRRIEEIPAIVDDAIEHGAKVIWMQLGLREPTAARRAREAGLTVIEDRCVKIEHCRFFGGLGLMGLSTGVVGSQRKGGSP